MLQMSSILMFQVLCNKSQVSSVLMFQVPCNMSWVSCPLSMVGRFWRNWGGWNWCIQSWKLSNITLMQCLCYTGYSLCIHAWSSLILDNSSLRGYSHNGCHIFFKTLAFCGISNRSWPERDAYQLKFGHVLLYVWSSLICWEY